MKECEEVACLHVIEKGRERSANSRAQIISFIMFRVQDSRNHINNGSRLKLALGM